MDYVRYLHSKQTVDDRAINRAVLGDFEAHISNICAENNNSFLRVVEVGGGVGAMFIRLLRRQALLSGKSTVEYTIVDVKRENLAAARQSITSEMVAMGHLQDKHLVALNSIPSRAPTINPDITGPVGAHHVGETRETGLQFDRINVSSHVVVNLVLGDAIGFLRDRKEEFDVLIGAAVLDLWELTPTLNIFMSALDKKMGVAAFYFPINFDGTTDFFPPSSEGHDFDELVERNFHHAMGRRQVCGHEALACHTGRRLIPCLQQLGTNVKSIGGSVWTVSPDSSGSYVADEAYFANCILDFIESSVPRTKCFSPGESQTALSRYIANRRWQIRNGKLFYVAHNIDVFGTL